MLNFLCFFVLFNTVKTDVKYAGTLKFLTQTIVPGRYYLYMHLEKNK